MNLTIHIKTDHLCTHLPWEQKIHTMARNWLAVLKIKQGSAASRPHTALSRGTPSATNSRQRVLPA
jgi:hypothetical protein